MKSGSRDLGRDWFHFQGPTWLQTVHTNQKSQIRYKDVRTMHIKWSITLFTVVRACTMLMTQIQDCQQQRGLLQSYGAVSWQLDTVYFTDNFYTSSNLAEHLLSNNTHLCGTVKTGPKKLSQRTCKGTFGKGADSLLAYLK